MKTVTVKSNYTKVTPRKMRLILDLIRGKKPSEAIEQIQFLSKTGKVEIVKLIKAGMSAAKNNDIDIDKTVISIAFANEGKSIKRRWLRAKGMSTQIKKTSSHVHITISEFDDVTTKKENDGS